MNKEFTRVLVTLSMIGTCGFTAQLSVAESTAEQDTLPATAEQTPAADQAGEPAPAGTPPSAENEATAETKPDVEPKPTGGTEDTEQTTAESTATAEKEAASEEEAGAEKDAAPEKDAASDKEGAPEKEPVTGAFGIPLGERFEPCMVTKVISQEEKAYRGPDKVELKGTLYLVEPKVPNKHFNAYSVATNADGIIYYIRGDHKPTEKASKCDLTRKLGAILAEKYGKPRGRGIRGEWYAFRDMTSSVYRGVRLFAPKCRHGRYSIVYSDDNAKQGEAPPAPEPTETSGL